MIAPVIPNDGEKTGKREASWRLLKIAIAFELLATGLELWLGVPPPLPNVAAVSPFDGLRNMGLAILALASAMFAGAYGIAAAKQAGMVGK